MAAGEIAAVTTEAVSCATKWPWFETVQGALTQAAAALSIHSCWSSEEHSRWKHPKQAILTLTLKPLAATASPSRVFCKEIL